jgi:hypothetical protein
MAVSKRSLCCSSLFCLAASFVETPEGKRPRGRAKCGSENTIKMGFKETRRDCTACTYRRWADANTGTGKFVQLSDKFVDVCVPFHLSG